MKKLKFYSDLKFIIGLKSHKIAFIGKTLVKINKVILKVYAIHRIV